jgi:hypothetical protein
MTELQRNVIVICNVANLTGTLNHGIKKADGSYVKLRVDYKALLDHVVGDRNLLGAYIVSQQDTTNSSGKSLEKLQATQTFVQRLKKFGWTPLRVPYTAENTDVTTILNTIWENSLSSLVEPETGQWKINTSLTDVVFINGSISWFDIVNAYFNQGFGVEIAYLKSATSKMLLANFAFLDLTNFLTTNNIQTVSKTVSSQRNHD